MSWVINVPDALVESTVPRTIVVVETRRGPDAPQRHATSTAGRAQGAPRLCARGRARAVRRARPQGAGRVRRQVTTSKGLGVVLNGG